MTDPRISVVSVSQASMVFDEDGDWDPAPEDEIFESDSIEIVDLNERDELEEDHVG